jgi:hypothetical protein
MSNAVKRFTNLKVQLFRIRKERTGIEDPREDDLLDEMEIIERTQATPEERKLINGPLEITQEQAADLGVMLGLPTGKRFSLLDAVIATRDQGWIRRGDLAYQHSPVRVFIDTGFTFEGEPLFVCSDCEPDSTFWRRKIA